MSAPSVDIERDFAERFVGVGWIHLIAAPVAKLRRAFRCFAEGAVKGGGEFRGITHDAGLVVACGVERLSDCADAAVHHVARGDEVGTGGGMGERGFDEQRDALVIQNVEMVAVDPRDAAMAVAHVFAEADIRNDEQLGTFGLDRTNRFLHDAILGVGAGCLLVLFVRDAEEDDGLQTGGGGERGLSGYFVRRKLRRRPACF